MKKNQFEIFGFSSFLIRLTIASFNGTKADTSQSLKFKFFLNLGCFKHYSAFLESKTSKVRKTGKSFEKNFERFLFLFFFVLFVFHIAYLFMI